MEPKIGQSHLARKALFRQGVKNGYLTVEDIEEALPAGTLTAAERWLLYYSLRAAEIEILGDTGELFGLETKSETEEAGEPR
ncbi:MAG TPA: RNA polymerase sigma factor region1.1 domain-containing protein [Vulgatibacter sp.]